MITDARMETEDAGFHVIRAARKQTYNPATALLTAYPPDSGHWKQEGAQSLLVKPVGTEDLLRQIEALLIRHEDEKHRPGQLKDRCWPTRLQFESGRRKEGELRPPIHREDCSTYTARLTPPAVYSENIHGKTPDVPGSV